MDNLSLNTLDYDTVLSALENGSHINLDRNNSNLSIDTIKSKVIDFSKLLNSIGRLSLLQCDKAECEEFVFLLLTLKKSIKHCLGELGSSKNKKNYNFSCCECNEFIDIDPTQDFWTCLQNHDHFEELYCRFLSGTLESINVNDLYDNPIAGTSNMEFGNENNENTDSGIDNENGEVDNNEPNSPNKENTCNEEEDVNSFRFNFVLHYDKAIENKIYPDSLMKHVQKIDKIREYTIQRSGLFRAVCLLCTCDLVSRTKVSKVVVMNHSMGQRHLRFAANPANLSALKKYHETWLNLEPNYQAHQVYFRPDILPSFKCVLCGMFINRKNLIQHIQTNPHKKKVLEMFEKRNNIFYLTDLQVEVYGITKEQIEAKDKEETKAQEAVKALVKNKKRNEKTDSDSSPSSDSKEFQHNIIKSVENIASTNALDMLPNRFKEHLTFLKNKGSMINCDACKGTLANDIETIKKHIRQSFHIKTSAIKQRRYNYYCEICNVKMIDEILWQRHFTEGPNKHANMAESRKNKTAEYECTKCCTVIYGDDLSLTRHLSVSLRREKKSKEIKLPEAVKKMFQTKETIENEAEKLTLEANDTLRYNQLTMECCARLEAALSATFEGCKAYPFGSRISGLGNKYSDLDVFIDTGGMYTGYKNQDSLAQTQFLRKATSIFSKLKNKEEYQDVVQISTARTPIVKLFHKKTEIKCDLSFRHGLSVENTKFIRFCLDLQQITQPFILILKKWSEHNKLAEHITTYALAFMAIFYLQINDYLLSVKKLRELNPQEPLVINGWETISYTMPVEQMKTFVQPYPHTVSRLLKDFFGYYAKFSYADDVICPLLGQTIKKTLFYEGSGGEKLPKEMNSYVTQLRSQEPEKFRAMSSFCIQDPFDLSHNLTKACQPGTLQKLKTLCELSFKHLENLK